MAVAVRYRDPRLETRERERFRILEFVHRATHGDPGAKVLCAKVADRLGLTRRAGAQLIAELAKAGLLAEAHAGPMVSLTPAGAAYIEWAAGQRRSVRLGGSERRVA